MFERFSAEARAAVLHSQTEARRIGHNFVGCEHLLLALTLQPAAAAAWSEAGVHHDRLEEAVRRIIGVRPPLLDADALSAIGIDLAKVRHRAPGRGRVRHRGVGNRFA